ncbi:MAG: cysteine desulfurase [Lactobacillales bacterium]|jgi:cysteine desulfurase|nr:cysteine desulfurase [Lactobacillales bacterium]
MIYLDNAATTAVEPAVLASYMETTKRLVGNPSSLHNLGVVSNRILNKAREQVAELLNAKADEIIFTSGGSEADNLAIKGTAWAKKRYGNHIIISAIEHPAVTRSAQWLETQGFELDYAPVDHDGKVIVEEFAKLIKPETILVSIMVVNNVVGSAQPIKKIAAVLEDYPNIHFHVDAVQALGKVAVEDFMIDRVDLASFSAHKFHGVKGVGILYKKEGRVIDPLIHGGGQEMGLRSTTENMAGIVSTAKALRLYLEKEKDCYDKKIRDYLYEQLGTYENVTLFSPEDTKNIVAFGIKGIRGEVLVHAFEEKEIYISTNSACSSRKKTEKSPLENMGYSPELAETIVRVSLDYTNAMAEIEHFMVVFNLLYKKLSKV